jgi:hypothetical protein
MDSARRRPGSAAQRAPDRLSRVPRSGDVPDRTGSASTNTQPAPPSSTTRNSLAPNDSRSTGGGALERRAGVRGTGRPREGRVRDRPRGQVREPRRNYLVSDITAALLRRSSTWRAPTRIAGLVWSRQRGAVDRYEEEALGPPHGPCGCTTRTTAPARRGRGAAYAGGLARSRRDPPRAAASALAGFRAGCRNPARDRPREVARRRVGRVHEHGKPARDRSRLSTPTRQGRPLAAR